MATTLRSSVVEITPKLAAQWLKTIVHQRPLNGVTLDKYIHQLQNGGWALNGETIKFDAQGHLMDGQHRLQAIVKANKKAKSVVVRGIAPDAVNTIDTGRNRDVRDAMVYAGVKHASFALAGAARYAWRITTDPRMQYRNMGSNQEILDYYRAATGFDNSIKFGDLAKGVIRSQAIGTALHYLFRQKNVELADQFMLQLGEGTGLNKDDTVYHLRERLIKNATMKAKLPRKDVAAMIIKAWNLCRAGKLQAPRQAVMWAAKGPNAEDFPTIR